MRQLLLFYLYILVGVVFIARLFYLQVYNRISHIYMMIMPLEKYSITLNEALFTTETENF